MRGTTALLGLSILAIFAAACSGEDLPDAGNTPDATFDGGVTFDSGVDSGVRDTGPTDPPDAGFADPSTLTQGFERVNGLRTWMLIKGTLTSTMPPLVFISSGPGHGYEYLVEPTRFLLGAGGSANPDRLLVYFDLAGVGHTGVSGTGSMTSSVSFQGHLANLDDTIAFVNTFAGRTGPVDLFGHGYGAGVASVYASQHPEKVSRLVLVAPYPSNVQDQATFFAETTARLTNPEALLARELLTWNICLMDIPRCGREYWGVIGPHWLCRENKDQFLEMEFESFEIRAWALYIGPDLRNTQYNWLTQLQAIRTPTTIIDGPCDITPLSVPQTYKDAIAGSELYVIPGSGHFPMVETSTTFQTVVKRALTYP
jgi:pimeloyl-ACP methyl ester carboxylesterase